MTKLLKNELLYGGRFLFRDNPALTARVAAELAGHARMDAQQLRTLARQRLHATLQRAIASLPYYRHLDPDFSPAEAEDALRSQFPVIDKATLLANRATLYPNGGAKKWWYALGKTSGTTGTPLMVFRSPRSVLYENEFLKRHWSWGGFEAGMKRATLRGDLVVPIDQAAPPYWFYNRYNNQLLLSSRHLTDHAVTAIIDKLYEFQPDMLQAYPSTAYTLASYLERQGRRLDVPVIFTASEPLYPHQREAILDRLGRKIMDMYGQAERVAFATQCEHGSMHLNTDYSHVELVDEQGNPTQDEGFVAGTTFHNDVMPLVRYRLSDRTRFLPGRCACGRAFPLIEPVTGKYEDAITGGDGMVVSPSVLTFAFKGIENIRRSQVAQVGPAHWEVRVVPDTHFSPADKDKLVHNIHHLVDARVRVDVVLREALPNTAAGKFRWVVNETK
ncbi:MAG: phenylacetate--CoA ligase family protein [Telluria sp.]